MLPKSCFSVDFRDEIYFYVYINFAGVYNFYHKFRIYIFSVSPYIIFRKLLFISSFLWLTKCKYFVSIWTYFHGGERAWFLKYIFFERKFQHIFLFIYYNIYFYSNPNFQYPLINYTRGKLVLNYQYYQILHYEH